MQFVGPEVEETGIALNEILDWMEAETVAAPQKLQIVEVVALESSFDLWGIKGTRVTEVNNRTEQPLLGQAVASSNLQRSLKVASYKQSSDILMQSHIRWVRIEDKGMEALPIERRVLLGGKINSLVPLSNSLCRCTTLGVLIFKALSYLFL